MSEPDPDEDLRDLRERRLERGLTVPGYVGDDGRYAPSTQTRLRVAWRRARDWAVSTGHTPISITGWDAETLGKYVMYLMDLGWTTETVGNAMSAVRAQHRLYGHPVPDSLPTWVMRRAEIYDQDHPANTGLPRDLLVKIYAFLPPTPYKGIRDRCLFSLLWATGEPLTRMVPLNIEDVRFAGRPPLVLILGGKERRIAHDHRTGMICPVEATRDWIAALADQPPPAATVGALFRSASRRGIAGTGTIRTPGPDGRAGDHRLSAKSMELAWGYLTASARVADYHLRDLRVGSHQDRR